MATGGLCLSFWRVEPYAGVVRPLQGRGGCVVVRWREASVAILDKALNRGQ